MAGQLRFRRRGIVRPIPCSIARLEYEAYHPGTKRLATCDDARAVSVAIPCESSLHARWEYEMGGFSGVRVLQLERALT